MDAASMANRPKTLKRNTPKSILRFPDFEQSKTAVVNSLAAASSQESYGHAMDKFIGWYCSEPRLSLNRTVVLRYRLFLEHWVIADLIGNGKHIRTVPMPDWVKLAVDEWTQAAGITSGFMFRAVSRCGAIWGDRITPEPYGT